jgi:XTP/dITP diphosphohydrolase
MKIVLATSNQGKLREFRQMCEAEIIAYSDLLEPFEIIEDGSTFAQNALIKAKTIYEKLGEGHIVIADDSGISLPILDGEPGIYSARYAREGASDKENLMKLVETIQSKGLTKTPAHYTASIAVVSLKGEYVVHGWMHGEVIDRPRGKRGFGYDPIFVPHGFDETLGELDEAVKSRISHRAKALTLAKPLVALLQERG